MSSETDAAIVVAHLSKTYQIYEKPSDRLKQMLMRGRRKYYRDFSALDDISFSIQQGETVGIIGRNGSGKSTLLQLICGTLNPSGGTIQTRGRIAALLELGSGFNPEFTGRENVFLNAAVLGLARPQIEARYDEIVAFAGIGDFIDQPVKTYSSGMAVRLAFAVVAHVDADILVIDEALSVGDAFFTQKCMRFLRNFMQSGTVLFVSHDTAAVKGLCSRCIWINEGRVQAIGPAKEVADLYLKDYYRQVQASNAGDAAPVDEEGSGEASSEVPFQAITTSTPGTPPAGGLTPGAAYRDQRQDLFNHSNLRNDIEVFQFSPDAPSFGTGGAEVLNVCMADTQDRPLNWVVGGEQVTVCIQAVAHQALRSPIVGFVVKDRLGQSLFGDNTYLTYLDAPVSIASGAHFETRFTFYMPRLSHGDYALTVAIAEGTQADHVQHHWVFDALSFRCESINPATGLVGVPFIDIRMHTVTDALSRDPHAPH